MQATWTAPRANLHQIPAFQRARCHSSPDNSSYDGCFWSVQMDSMMSEQVPWLWAVLTNSSRMSRRVHVETRASRSNECEKRQIRVRFCCKIESVQVRVAQRAADTHDDDSVNAEQTDYTACGRVASHAVANSYRILWEVAAQRCNESVIA